MLGRVRAFAFFTSRAGLMHCLSLSLCPSLSISLFSRARQQPPVCRIADAVQTMQSEFEEAFYLTHSTLFIASRFLPLVAARCKKPLDMPSSYLIFVRVSSCKQYCSNCSSPSALSDPTSYEAANCMPSQRQRVPSLELVLALFFCSDFSIAGSSFRYNNSCALRAT